jgi:hypothetical protein
MDERRARRTSLPFTGSDQASLHHQVDPTGEPDLRPDP